MALAASAPASPGPPNVREPLCSAGSLCASHRPDTPCLCPQNVLGIILGGGAGTRLYPLTKKRAKPAVPLVRTHRHRHCIFCQRPCRPADAPPAPSGATHARLASWPWVCGNRSLGGVAVNQGAVFLAGALLSGYFACSPAATASLQGCNYRLIDIPVSNCINSDINKIYCLTQFNSASLNRHLSSAYNSNVGSYTRQGFVEVLAAQQSPENPDWFQGTADAVRQYLWLFKVRQAAGRMTTLSSELTEERACDCDCDCDCGLVTAVL